MNVSVLKEPLKSTPIGTWAEFHDSVVTDDDTQWTLSAADIRDSTELAAVEIVMYWRSFAHETQCTWTADVGIDSGKLVEGFLP